MNRPPIHVLAYAETGTGKSTFAQTFVYAGNVLVFCFDAHGKDMPYRKNAVSDSDLKYYEIAGPYGVVRIQYRDVVFDIGNGQKSVIRLEYYHDPEPDKPVAYELFSYRMAVFQKEAAAWPTVVIDSLTSMELIARKREEKVLNPMQKFGKGTDTRQWFSGSTDALEEMVIMRFGALPQNVVVISHIDERRNEVSGEILRGPFAPGRLSKRGTLCAQIQEQYHFYCVRDEGGKRRHLMQTANDGQWHATSQIDAPDPCYPHYLSLWENWDKNRRPIEEAKQALKQTLGGK